MNLSIILPAYNEQENINQAVASCIDACRRHTDEFEIILIDDKSTDGTPELAEKLAAEHPQVTVIHNERNIGQGASQIKGFAASKHEFVMHNGMDCPFDFADLGKMLPLFENADVVVASRTGRPGYTFYRRVLSWVNRTLLRLLFPLKLRDYNFIQIYRKQVLDAVNVADIKATSAGFVVPEILITAHDLGFRIVETPVEYHRRQAGLATVGNPKVVLRSLRDLFGFWWARLRSRKQLARKKVNAS